MPKRPPQIKMQAFLANLPMFSEMGAAELDRIAAATVPLHFDKGQSANALIPARATDLGLGAAYLDVLVRIRPLQEERRG